MEVLEMSEFIGGKYGLCYGCNPDIITAKKVESLLEQIESMKCCGNCNEWQPEENGPGDCLWEGTQKNLVGIKPLHTSGDQGDGCAGWKLHRSRNGAV